MTAFLDALTVLLIMGGWCALSLAFCLLIITGRLWAERKERLRRMRWEARKARRAGEWEWPA